MGKTKRRARREARKKSVARPNAAREDDEQSSLPFNPPRRNLPMLLISAGLLLAWLVFLVCVALFS